MITTANTESISCAADELQVVQPTLSKYIFRLEIDIGIELFGSNTIPFLLIIAGELHVIAGKRKIDNDCQLHKQLQEAKYNQNFGVKVGISPSRAPYLMSYIVSRYQAIENSGEVIIQEATVSELKNHLIMGSLGFIIRLADEGIASFESVDLFDETTILLAVLKVLDNHSTPEDMLLTLPHMSIGWDQYMLNVIKESCIVPAEKTDH